jgi:hypothetical protein
VTRLVCAIALAAAFAAPAQAVFVDVAASDLGGNTVDFAVLPDGTLAVDPHFATATPMRIALVLEAGDPTPLVWNALVDNLTGELWSAFEIEAIGATLGLGSAVANAGAVAAIEPTASGARILLDPGEPAGLDLGAVFGVGTDWTLTPSAGAAVALRLVPTAVPEPVSLVTLAFGLGVIGARSRSSIVARRHARASRLSRSRALR